MDADPVPEFSSLDGPSGSQSRSADAVPYKVRATAVTHVGRVRERNEDAVAVGPCVWVSSRGTPAEVVLPLGDPVLCVVADGLGGHSAGDVASSYVVRRLSERAPGLQSGRALASALVEINEELRRLMAADPRTAGMGTTVAGLLITASEIFFFNVGDSRVYRQQDGFLRQLSVDDALHPDREPGGPRHRDSHVITQALGGSLDAAAPEPHIGSEPLTGGRRYLVCTDGLTDMVDIETMERCLEADDLTAVSRLLEVALAEGGRDNVSVIVVRVLPRMRDPDAGGGESG